MAVESAVLNVNPTPIGVYKNKNQRRDRDLIVSSLERLSPSFERDGISRYEDEGCFLSTEAKVSVLRDWIEACAEDFARNVLKLEFEGKLNVSNSWLNKSSAQGTQGCHMHANAVLSGTYYVKRKKCHSPIVFFRGEQLAWPTRPSFHLEASEQGPYNSHTAVEPNEGDLLLWSSEVLHGYPPSGADGRISLSMNFLPERLPHLYGFQISKRR